MRLLQRAQRREVRPLAVGDLLRDAVAALEIRVLQRGSAPGEWGGMGASRTAYVRNDDDAVFGYVQVGLETARADFHGALEGRHGVLGEGIAVAAVRERLGIPPGIGLLCCAGDHG